VIQFKGVGKPWLPFMEKCIKFREEGRDSGTQVQVMVAKALLNTFFGSSIMKIEGRKQTLFVPENKIEMVADKDNFYDCVQSGPSDKPSILFETQLIKQSVQQNSAKQIGFWILNCSKMILLRFIHLQLQHYLRPGTYEILATDTDSCILAVSTGGNDLRALCKPELKTKFDEQYEKIFVTKDEDSLKPLLMKIEYEGDVFVGLASKTYHTISNKDCFPKIACKGIPQTIENQRVLSMSNYIATVFDTDEERYKATVRGMRVDSDKVMRTYVQEKSGLRRFCPKVGYFPCCAICDFPRELKDDPYMLARLYPYHDRHCGVNYDSLMQHITDKLPNLIPK
jgi:hypothetical protein